MKPVQEEVPTGDVGGNLGGEEKTCLLVLFLDVVAQEGEAIRLLSPSWLSSMMTTMKTMTTLMTTLMMMWSGIPLQHDLFFFLFLTGSGYNVF